MKRGLKLSGLVVVLTLSIAAMTAASALAVEGVGEAGSYPATITATQIGSIVTTLGVGGSRSMRCTTEKFSGTLSGPASTLTITPTYAGCVTNPGGGPASITMNGCDYSVTASQRLSSTSGKGVGSLVCPVSGIVEIVATSTAGSVLCEWRVSSQGPLESATWASKASTPSDVEISFNLSGIQAKVVKGTLAACGAAVGGTTSASTVGEVTATADNSSGIQVSLVIS